MTRSRHSLGPAASLQPIARSYRPALSSSRSSRVHPRATRAVVAMSALALLCGAARELHGNADSVTTRVHGTPMPRTTDSGQPQRWQQREVVVAIDESVEAFGLGARDAIQMGFGAWLSTHPEVPDLVFDRTTGSRGPIQDGVNTVMVAPITVPGHEDDIAITVSYSSAATGEILEADLILNANEAFTIVGAEDHGGNEGVHDDIETDRAPDRPAASSEGNGKRRRNRNRNRKTRGGADDHDIHGDDDHRCVDHYDVQNVVTHEVGHFFGLSEDHDLAHATMYPRTGRCETHKRDLLESDVDAMASLYEHDFVDPGTGCGGARIARGRTNESNSGGLVVALVAAFALARRWGST